MKGAGDTMTETKPPIAIKKYANRRLYHTGTSTYVTLEDLAKMVRSGEDFVVTDARTSEDITRSVLAQIIFELEGQGQNLLPITFLRQLIRFYGDSMQALVPRYLEFSIERFINEQQRFREQMSKAFGASPFTPIEEQVRANMTLFKEAVRMFTPFVPGEAAKTEDGDAKPAEKESIDDLKQQVAAMKQRLDKLDER